MRVRGRRADRRPLLSSGICAAARETGAVLPLAVRALQSTQQSFVQHMIECHGVESTASKPRALRRMEAAQKAEQLQQYATHAELVLELDDTVSCEHYASHPVIMT